jgi:hypothetical protein
MNDKDRKEALELAAHAEAWSKAIYNELPERSKIFHRMAIFLQRVAHEAKK